MASKKPSRKAAAKKPARRQSTAKKGARKAAAKSPRKAAAKSPRKAAAKKGARKAAAKKGARKAAAKAPKKTAPKARKSAAREKAAPAALAPSAFDAGGEEERMRPRVEQVETTSAGIQPLAPEHAAVDELTSSGNELLDIFQKYDRNRTGSIEAAEFARLLEALGQNITDEELAIAFDIIDSDRTGKISWKEFKNWWTSR